MMYSCGAPIAFLAAVYISDQAFLVTETAYYFQEYFINLEYHSLVYLRSALKVCCSTESPPQQCTRSPWTIKNYNPKNKIEKSFVKRKVFLSWFRKFIFSRYHISLSVDYFSSNFVSNRILIDLQVINLCRLSTLLVT